MIVEASIPKKGNSALDFLLIHSKVCIYFACARECFQSGGCLTNLGNKKNYADNQWNNGDFAEVGIGLIGFGFFFTFLGVILFFDRGLLALGNIIWLSGVALLLGWHSTWQLFTKRMNYKGSVSFFVGLFLIFVRWPIFGIILEIYGSIVLFGGFWPSVKVALYQIPVVGWFLQYPVMFLDRMRRSFG
ncbi:vesicle transport protein GOT1 isoform X2 [Magnolia sinica]|uniref:vesicle transport protein GOT1 isoform X2 n=1 Tax=Magnolia sinica TaxID=86752 RepID=UPI00265925C7|nr:vesicle transport protein GOT1 isoform X2 [Magnolia sinica]